jgi:hypothetical protein
LGQVLPASLPRTDIHHEPDSTTCQCGCQLKRIGEDVAEKLDYVPGNCYNPVRLHSKLENLPPNIYEQQLEAKQPIDASEKT